MAGSPVEAVGEGGEEVVVRVKVVAFISLILAILLTIWFLLGYLFGWSEQVWLLLLLSFPLFIVSFLLFREDREELNKMEGGVLKDKEGASVIGEQALTKTQEGDDLARPH